MAILIKQDDIELNQKVYMVDDKKDYIVTYTNKKTVNGFTVLYLNLIHIDIKSDGSIIANVKNDVHHLDCRVVL